MWIPILKFMQEIRSFPMLGGDLSLDIRGNYLGEIQVNRMDQKLRTIQLDLKKIIAMLTLTVLATITQIFPLMDLLQIL